MVIVGGWLLNWFINAAGTQLGGDFRNRTAISPTTFDFSNKNPWPASFTTSYRTFCPVLSNAFHRP